VKELIIDAVIENVAAVTAFADEELEAHDCGMKAQMQIDVAIDELFSNIAYYAYAPAIGKARIEIDFPAEDQTVITFEDTGIPYNPLEKEDPDVTLSLEERRVGGLGIFMVKKTMDRLTYSREDGKNILKIYKKIG